MKGKVVWVKDFYPHNTFLPVTGLHVMATLTGAHVRTHMQVSSCIELCCKYCNTVITNEPMHAYTCVTLIRDIHMIVHVHGFGSTILTSVICWINPYATMVTGIGLFYFF